MSLIREALKSIPGLHRIGRSLRWFGRMVRIHWSEDRIFLTYPPGHYYSPLPHLGDLDRHLQALESVVELPGINLHHDDQLAWLNRFAVYTQDWPLKSDTTAPLRYFNENHYLPSGDAFVLAGFLRELKPKRVVEVGSGYSSALMLDVASHFDTGGTQFTFIDPDPSRLKHLLTSEDWKRAKIIEKPVQTVALETFTSLESNDILFIDSSHVSKAASDLNHIFFEVLPCLKRGVYIHFHDVFWPFEYPRDWLIDNGIAWNEAYLTRALLLGGDRFRIVFHLSYLEKVAAHSVTQLLPAEMLPNKSTGAPGSIWIQKVQ